MSETINSLLEGNKQWVSEILKNKPDFFKLLEAEQAPSVTSDKFFHSMPFNFNLNVI